MSAHDEFFKKARSVKENEIPAIPIKPPAPTPSPAPSRPPVVVNPTKYLLLGAIAGFIPGVVVGITIFTLWSSHKLSFGMLTPSLTSSNAVSSVSSNNPAPPLKHLKNVQEFASAREVLEYNHHLAFLGNLFVIHETNVVSTFIGKNVAPDVAPSHYQTWDEAVIEKERQRQNRTDFDGIETFVLGLIETKLNADSAFSEGLQHLLDEHHDELTYLLNKYEIKHSR